jgi:four helix bundle suffix protein
VPSHNSPISQTSHDAPSLVLPPRGDLLGKTSPLSFEVFREFIETRPAQVVANIGICLIHQANYLLDQQLKRLEQDFLKDGGLRERMTRARLQAREQQRNGQG